MVFMTRVVYECSLHDVDREHGCPFFLRAKRGNLKVQKRRRDCGSSSLLAGSPLAPRAFAARPSRVLAL